jgi:hypothetical protein
MFLYSGEVFRKEYISMSDQDTDSLGASSLVPMIRQPKAFALLQVGGTTGHQLVKEKILDRRYIGRMPYITVESIKRAAANATSTRPSPRPQKSKKTDGAQRRQPQARAS